jgi:prepilin signal peptidase PulO-like enzyme (type II secretory pathway)
VLGLYLGPYGLLVLLFGSVFGAVYGLAAARKAEEGMRHKFPFGPFLAMAAVIVTLVGPQLVSWYLHTLTGIQ